MRTPRVVGPLALTLLLSTWAAGVGAQEFGYSGDLGPAHWGELDPTWAVCESGERQSPVDFVRRGLPGSRFERIELHYGPTHGEIFNNGHTIEVETEGHNTLVLDDTEYELVQFHFHTPSEHRVRGRGYDMELHLVHRSDEGALAVLGVLLRRAATSGALEPIFARLPDEIDVHVPLEEEFDPSAFLPASPAHHRYSGSLTTPPCTEGVSWFVFDEPMTVSDEDMARFNERVVFNARPVQRAVR